MKIKIRRRMYVITRNDTDIFCGLARNYEFKSISEIEKQTVVFKKPIKTYSSIKMAENAFKRSWGATIDNIVYKIVPVSEEIYSIGG